MRQGTDSRVNALLLRVEALEGQVAYLENALRLNPQRDWQLSVKQRPLTMATVPPPVDPNKQVGE